MKLYKVFTMTTTDLPDYLPRPFEHRPGALPDMRVHTWLFDTNNQAQTFRRRLVYAGFDAKTCAVGQ